MAKTKKAQKSQKIEEEGPNGLTVVLSFRVSAATDKFLSDATDQSPIVGVNSGRQLARKIVEDYVAGRLVYTDPRHKLYNVV